MASATTTSGKLSLEGQIVRFFICGSYTVQNVFVIMVLINVHLIHFGIHVSFCD